MLVSLPFSVFLFLFLVWSDVKVAFWPKKTNNFGRTGLSRSSAGSWPLAWANARDQDIEMLYYLANNCSVSTLYRFTLKKKNYFLMLHSFLLASSVLFRRVSYRCRRTTSSCLQELENLSSCKFLFLFLFYFYFVILPKWLSGMSSWPQVSVLPILQNLSSLQCHEPPESCVNLVFN